MTQRLLNAKRKMFFARPSGLLLAAAIGLMNGPVAFGGEGACEAHFARSLDRAQPQLQASPVLSESTTEYIRRLFYLVKERRLLTDRDLERLAAAERPVSALQGHAIDTTLFAHQSAFLSLLEENDLQWEQIREATRSLLSSIKEDQKREDSAIQETAKIMRPAVEKSFPFRVDRIVRTADSRRLAVTSRIGAKTTIRAFDLQTDQLIAESTFEGRPSDERPFPYERVVGGSHQLSFFIPGRNEIATVDLLPQRVPSEPIVASLKIPARFLGPKAEKKFKPAGFVEVNGKLRFLMYSQRRVYHFDAMTGSFLHSYPLNGLKLSLFSTNDSFGSSLFFSQIWQPTFLIEPSQPKSVRKLSKISLFTGFSYQGKRYALGEDLTTPPEKGKMKVRMMNLETGEVTKSFQVELLSGDNPELLQTFEQDGVFYGVLATNGHDVYLVDLLKGEIVQSRSKSPALSSIRLNWGEESAGQIGFRYKGRQYLLGTYREDVRDKVPPSLVFVDAVTFEPVGARLQLRASNLSVRLVHNEGDEITVIINYKDGTSQQLSLVGPT